MVYLRQKIEEDVSATRRDHLSGMAEAYQKVMGLLTVVMQEFKDNPDNMRAPVDVAAGIKMRVRLELLAVFADIEKIRTG